MFGAQRIYMAGPWEPGTLRGLYGQRPALGQQEECTGEICPAPSSLPPEFRTPPTTTTEDAQPPTSGLTDLERVVALTYEAYKVNRECWAKVNALPLDVPDSEIIPMLEECIRSAGQGAPITNVVAPSAEFPILPVAIGAGALILLLSL